MPLWLNRDVNMPEVGDDPIHRAYYTLEAQTIAKRLSDVNGLPESEAKKLLDLTDDDEEDEWD